MFANTVRQSLRQTARVSRLAIARGLKTQASHQKSNRIGLIAAAVGTVAVIGYSGYQSTAATHKKVVALGEIKKQQELEHKRAEEEAEKKRIAEKEARERKALEKAQQAKKAKAEAEVDAGAGATAKGKNTDVSTAEASKKAKSSDAKDAGEDHKEAYDPDTGEINWDCPCLGGMADGPCGEEFKAAFSCFVYSKEEPKGIECIDKFKNMQDCFRRYPDVYAEELRDDDDYGEVPAADASGKAEDVKGDKVNAPSTAKPDKATEIVDAVKEKAGEIKDKVSDQVSDTKEKVDVAKDKIKEKVKTNVENTKEAAEEKLDETDARLQAAKDYLKAQTEEEGKILQAKTENQKKFVEAAAQAKATETKEYIEQSHKAVVSEAEKVAERLKGDTKDKTSDKSTSDN